MTKQPPNHRVPPLISQLFSPSRLSRYTGVTVVYGRWRETANLSFRAFSVISAKNKLIPEDCQLGRRVRELFTLPIMWIVCPQSTL
jgi:hypothetical protein